MLTYRSETKCRRGTKRHLKLTTRDDPFWTKDRARGGGGYITCRGYRYVPPIWVGFWAPNSLNKGPFFGRSSINKGGLSRNWRKIAKNG